MFTGIIQALGKVTHYARKQGDVRLQITANGFDITSVTLGDSIAVNGVCLTVVAIDGNNFVADVSQETLQLSTLGSMDVGCHVNLEKALTLNTLLGGHLVTGHVDGVGKIMAIESSARSIKYVIKAPGSLQHYIAKKGSITVDGTSLTVNEISDSSFSVNIVPHTQSKTIFQHYQKDQAVNLEVDIIARYLERLLQKSGEQSSKLSVEFLRNHGFNGP